jgi:large subunit ribosomal protein L18
LRLRWHISKRGKKLANRKIEKVRDKRKLRVRKKVAGSQARPRLCVFRSASHIYVQAIDDVSGRTIAAASSLAKELSGDGKNLKKTEMAKSVGMLVAKRLQEIGVADVVFDRGRFLYHGRVKSLADGAREAGLNF